MAKEVIFVADDFGMNDEDQRCYSSCPSFRPLEWRGSDDGPTGHRRSRGDGARPSFPANRLASASQRFHSRHHRSLAVGCFARCRRVSASAFSSRARDLMRREVARQWELFQANGPRMPLHQFASSSACASVRLSRAARHGRAPISGWIRLGKPHAFRSTRFRLLWSALGWTYLERRRRLSAWRATDTLWGLDRIFHMNAGEVQAALATLPDGFHEFLFHPRTRSCPDTLCLIELKSSLARS